MLKKVFQFLGYTAAVALTGVLLLLLSLALLPENRQPAGASLILMVMSVALIYGSPAIVGMWFWQKNRKSKLKLDAQTALESEKEALRRRFFERERLIDAVDVHRTALTRNLERAIRRNDYGAVVEDRRSEALVEFFASIDLDTDALNITEAVQVVSEQLTLYDEQDRKAGFDSGNLPFDGHAFERWVASALSGFGWDAEVTAASGDQGIDVIASRGGRKIGLQCKLYSSPIGNKAVQEAHAGKAYHGLEKVGVLSNADFTSSAKSLAAATGVLLVSHHDIPRLYEIAFSR